MGCYFLEPVACCVRGFIFVPRSDQGAIGQDRPVSGWCRGRRRAGAASRRILMRAAAVAAEGFEIADARVAAVGAPRRVLGLPLVQMVAGQEHGTVQLIG